MGTPPQLAVPDPEVARRPLASALALEMADDRNLTVHTCQETLARQIFGRLTGHASLLRRWIEARKP
ncbi:MAG: hypothetical protein ACYCWW_13640 [Deltaproteobacteria bacterium]